nr:hypothetical protein [Corynebacterium lactis]
MKVTHLKEGVLVAALISLAWAGPAAFAALAPKAESIPVGQDPIVLEGANKVTFQAPSGWKIAPGASNESISLEKGESVISFEVLTGADGAQTTLERAMLNINRRGKAAVWEPKKIDVKDAVTKGDESFDLTGRECSVIDPATVDSGSRLGRCAIASGSDVALIVMSFGPVRGADDAADTAEVADPAEILKSARVEIKAVEDGAAPAGKEGGENE